MKPVARYQMQLELNPGEAERQRIVRELILAWIRSKVQSAASLAESRDPMIGATDRGDLVSRLGSVDGAGAWGYTYRETSPQRRFETIIDVVETGNELCIDIVLRAEPTASELAPQRVDVYRPRLIASLLNQVGLKWRFGPSPLLNKELTFTGEIEGDRLARIALADDRLIPLVVISQDSYKLDNCLQLAALIQQDLLGVCLVATCDKKASFKLASILGAGLGVYGGAVRLYWPNMKLRKEKWHHPLFLLPRDPEATDDRWWETANLVRSRIRWKIFSVSANSPTVIRSASLIYRDTERAELARTRAELIRSNDHKTLADLYEADNSKLIVERDKLREDLELEKAKVTNLTLALGYRDKPAVEFEDDVVEEIEPKTVQEAVSRAERELDLYITFGDDIRESLGTLRTDAGPPGKILDYLEALALLADEKREGPLGKTDAKWLQEQNIDASIESESIRNNNKEMERRRWSVNGVSKQFELHLKPSDGASPDRCVRIYFLWNPESKKIEIGYIGRHL